MEGGKVAEIMFSFGLEIAKAAQELLSKMLGLIANLLMTYVKHRIRKREIDYITRKVLIRDKVALGIAKNLKKTLVNKEKILDSEIRKEKHEFDMYKIEKQHQFEKINTKIKNLTREIKNAPVPEKKILQERLNDALEEKADFERDVNKNLLEKSNKIESMENEHKRLLKDLHICNKAITDFAGKGERDLSEVVRNEFEDLITKEYMPGTNIENAIQNNNTIDQNKSFNEPENTKQKDEQKDAQEVEEKSMNTDKNIESNNDKDKHKENDTKENRQEELMKKYEEIQKNKSKSIEHIKGDSFER